MLNDPTLPDDHPINRLDPAVFIRNQPGRFAAKMGFAERCAVLALHMKGVGKPLLAHVFGVDRRTIGHIVNPQSKHYKDVRREAEKLGEVEFKRAYITEGVQLRVNAMAHDPEVTMNRRVMDKVNVEKGPNPRAVAHAGWVTMSTDNDPTVKTRRFEIKYLQEGSKFTQMPGWYWREEDMPDDEFVGDDHGTPFNTSTLAMKYIKVHQ